ncbi:MAG: hypothetical protein AAB509_02175 [Patescibacteria group bacterium]
MNKFSDLYDFVGLAQSNRKYTESVVNNLKSSLKIFGKELNEEELGSVDVVKDRIQEIFISVVSNNKNKNIGSLNTYKARLLRIINDYKKYGANPGKIQGWTVNKRQSTPLLNGKDKKDKALSLPTNTLVDNVHKIELALDSNSKATLLIPKNITKPESEALKTIIDSLTKK